jgi:hypothetical protein
MLAPVVGKAASLRASSSDVIFTSKKEPLFWLQRPIILARKIFEAILGGIIPLFVLTNQGYIYYPKNQICKTLSVSIPLCLVNVLVYY